ncbi:MAG: hypothetical protein OEZ06_15070 [Myxococcales bacterium]|nr:hypothetical protein [Myxococcales bacterium]
MNEPQQSTQVRALPRAALIGVSLPTAALLGFGALVLPWTRMTTFAVVTSALGGLHLAVVALLLARTHAARRALRLLGLGSLLYLAWIAQQVFASGLYVAEIYGSLGKGVAAGMGALVLLVALLTLPLGLWALSLTAPQPKPRSLLAWLLGALVLGSLASGATWAKARARSLPTPANLAHVGGELLRARASNARATPGASLFTPAAVQCPAAPGPQAATVVTTFADRRGSVRSLCLQGAADELPDALARSLAQHGASLPIKLDWLKGAHSLHEHPGLLGPLVDVLGLRPGLDGACLGARCLMPWQLLATGAFAAREATPYIPKMRLGFAVAQVRAALSDDEGGTAEHTTIEGLTRITTESSLIDAGGRVHGLQRMRAREAALTAAALARAERAAEAHVLAAQRHDGTYRYQLDAYRGTSIEENPSIPRHAGTTLVLCELGQRRPEVEQAIARALMAQRRYGRRRGELTALTYRPLARAADLGSSALGLVAFTACRERVGPVHDVTIGRLARFLMQMQRPDGSFGPGLDLQSGHKLDGPTPVFAAGQAIMALTQLEAIVAKLEPQQRAPFPDAQALHNAVERAMTHTAEHYWPHPLRDFFFLKENWHCLAARKALRSHRHDGYERFCLDYTGFKARVLLGPEDDVEPGFHGGFGFGNIVPPHNGSSAGLGEALGAAIALREARGEDSGRERHLLKRVLGFLLRQQMQPELCFACATENAAGWFSGYMVAPWGRIDHIQHPWSALGHGLRALGWKKS